MVCKVIKRGLSGWSWPIQGSWKWEPQGHAFMQVALLWHHYSRVCSKEVRDSDRSLRKWARTSFLPCAFKRTQSPVSPMSSASWDSGLGGLPSTETTGNEESTNTHGTVVVVWVCPSPTDSCVCLLGLQPAVWVLVVEPLGLEMEGEGESQGRNLRFVLQLCSQPECSVSCFFYF